MSNGGKENLKMGNYVENDYSKWDLKKDHFTKNKHITSHLIYGRIPFGEVDVSVVIPTFRRANLLKEAVYSALNQETKYKYIIIVVDNCSEGDIETDKLMCGLCAVHTNVLYYRNAVNLGIFGNWNRCIELVQTKWLCLLHDDDLLHVNYIEVMYPKAKDSNYGLIGSYRTILDQRNHTCLHMSETGKSEFVSHLLNFFISVRRGKGIQLTNQDATRSMFFPANIYMLNREKAIEVGGYDDSFAPFADQFFHEKIIKYSGGEFIPLMLFTYRIAQNESLKEETLWKALVQHASLAQAISKKLGMSEKKCKSNFWESVVVVYNNFLDVKEKISFSKISEQLNIPPKYSRKWVQRWVMMKYNLRWGLLLFRKSKG